jgi:transcriptional regulator with XRE-family HTH domain
VFRDATISAASRIVSKRLVITGLKCRRSLGDSGTPWHRVPAMTALRALRRTADLSQRECAALIGVPVNRFRMWDSGLRPAPLHVLQRTQVAVTTHARDAELVSLDQLASELGVHQRTLRAAARTGRLQVTFSSRSAFGRPIRLATRAAAHAFMRKDYGRYSGQSPAAAPLPLVPCDYDERLKLLRRRLRLTQHDLARRIGAANKAVVFSGSHASARRRPSFGNASRHWAAPARRPAMLRLRQSGQREAFQRAAYRRHLNIRLIDN